MPSESTGPEVLDHPFTAEHYYTVLGKTVDADLLNSDLDQQLARFQQWNHVTIPGDDRHRFHSVAVGERVDAYLRGLFAEGVEYTQAGWFMLPGASIGPYHVDSKVVGRNTAINVDMKRGDDGATYFLENPPEVAGKLIRVEYPADTLVMLNVRRWHMVMNGSPKPRIILTIGMANYYHDLLARHHEDGLFR